MDAAAYRKFSIDVQRGEMELFARLDLKSSGQLLDLGCGDGRVTAQIAEALPNWQITGLDPNAEMLALAKESTHPNLHFQLGTLSDLDQTFDAISLFSALHLIPEPEQVLASCYRHLEPGGQLLLLTYPLDSPASQTLRDILNAPEWAHCVNRDVVNARRYLSQYQQTLADLGFQTVHHDTYPSERLAETPEGLTQTISMALPFFGNFTPSEKQSCAEAIAAAFGTTRFELLTFAYIGRK